MQDAPKAVWSIPYVFVAFFPSLKQNFTLTVSSAEDTVNVFLSPGLPLVVHVRPQAKTGMLIFKANKPSP